ncbi:GMC family oxidoreductase [Pendulispora albinea]|uniref:GMC family oxidoreductase n=1 Tax=Pendulispora albinea TaxID=2741071 RepID=A0ABZ2LLD4_9BACT
MTAQAHDIEADVIIVGAGIVGTLVATRLARAGVRVVILEAGPRVDRERALQRYRESLVKLPETPYEAVAHAPAPRLDAIGDYYVQAGPENFQSNYLRLVGGTLWHWLGTTPRLHPSDFEMKSRFGVGVDWPIGYAELEPYYAEAERVLGVAGEGDLESPRSTPYPMPPIALTHRDRAWARAIAPLGLRVNVNPQARNSTAYDGRPPCDGQASCVPICPTVARFDASVQVARAERAGVRIVENAVAVFIEVGEGERIRCIHVRRPDGTSQIARGRSYVLAAHSIETPKLLFLSRTAERPHGIANGSDQVGRHLMDHPAQLTWALAREPLGSYRAPHAVAGIDHFRFRDFEGADPRAQRSAFRVELRNDGWNFGKGGPTFLLPELLARGRGVRGASLQRELALHAHRQSTLLSLMEQLPDPENRITLAEDALDSSGLPRPKIHFALGDYERQGLAAARATHDRLFQALGATNAEHAPTWFGAGHILGTYRMGNDPKTSVVSARGRSHDHANLFILGGGQMPTGGTVNPTLTVTALALYALPEIQKALSGS